MFTVETVTGTVLKLICNIREVGIIIKYLRNQVQNCLTM